MLIFRNLPETFINHPLTHNKVIPSGLILRQLRSDNSELALSKHNLNLQCHADNLDHGDFGEYSSELREAEPLSIIKIENHLKLNAGSAKKFLLASLIKNRLLLRICPKAANVQPDRMAASIVLNALGYC